MRLVPLLIISLVAASLTGCFGKDDTGGDPGTEPTPTASPTPTGGSSPTPTASPSPAPSPTPAPLAPKSIKKGTANFAGPAPPGAETITIDPGYTTLTLNVTFQNAASADAPFVASGVSIKVGSLVCTVPDGPSTAAVKCAKTGVATPGAAKVEFAGTGTVVGNWEVIES